MTSPSVDSLEISKTREDLNARLEALGLLLEKECPFEQIRTRSESEPLPEELWRKLREAGWLETGASDGVNVAALARAMGEQGLPAHCAEHLVGLISSGFTADSDTRLCLALAPRLAARHVIVRFAAWAREAIISGNGRAVILSVQQMPALRTIAGEGWLRLRLPSGSVNAEHVDTLALRRWLHLSRAAETYGVLTRLFRLTRDYVTQRQQFGRPLGSFQAVQHKIADMVVGLVATEALICKAIGDVDVRHVWAARLCVDSIAQKTASDAVQLHGAMGLSREYPAELFYRRTQMLRLGQEQQEDLLSSMWSKEGRP
jgi:hypothetical protein